MAQPERCDVLIVGGGVVGLSIACFLKTLAPATDVVVVKGKPYGERGIL